MGYSTDFNGKFAINPQLSPAQVRYLEKFNQTRRMIRSPEILEAINLPDEERVEVELPFGVEGEYFTGGLGDYGQASDGSVVNNNQPPSTQPGLWCQWTPSEDGSALMWDEGEKFYHYIEWLQYMIDNFFKPWGVVLNGEVGWFGEDREDFGRIKVIDNQIKVRTGHLVYDND